MMFLIRPECSLDVKSTWGFCKNFSAINNAPNFGVDFSKGHWKLQLNLSSAWPHNHPNLQQKVQVSASFKPKEVHLKLPLWSSLYRGCLCTSSLKFIKHSCKRPGSVVSLPLFSDLSFTSPVIHIFWLWSKIIIEQLKSPRVWKSCIKTDHSLCPNNFKCKICMCSFRL